MAIRSKDELMTVLKGIVGDSTDEAMLGMLEDVSDTYDSLASVSADTTDWKQKYEDNDKAWKQKYRDRFFNGSEQEKEEEKEEDINDSGEDSPKTFEDLFREETK